MEGKQYVKKSMDELERQSTEEHINANHFPIIIVLDDVRSMHNVGSVFRTADAFNVACVYLCGVTPVPPHRDIHKTALGATESVQWQYAKNIVECLQELKSKGYKIYAVEQVHQSVSLSALQIPADEKAVFIFGNEVMGVSNAALAFCDTCIEIPQWGAKHSLNIAVSVGVVLWEKVRGIRRD